MNTFLAGIFGLAGPELIMILGVLAVPILIIFIIVKVVNGGGATKEQRIAKLVADELERRKENENKH